LTDSRLTIHDETDLTCSNEVNESAKTSTRRQHARVFILFFCTSGRPYTTETLIQSVGPGLGLLTLLLVPIVWSIPEVFIVGELASMLPEEGGYYR
jgi:hypothetical protein